METVYAAADLLLARAGAATVCEVAAVGVPAVFVPLPIGNGEQALNADGLVQAGGALLVADRDFTPEWVSARAHSRCLTDRPGWRPWQRTPKTSASGTPIGAWPDLVLEAVSK